MNSPLVWFDIPSCAAGIAPALGEGIVATPVLQVGDAATGAVEAFQPLVPVRLGGGGQRGDVLRHFGEVHQPNTELGEESYGWSIHAPKHGQASTLSPAAQSSSRPFHAVLMGRAGQGVIRTNPSNIRGTRS